MLLKQVVLVVTTVMKGSTFHVPVSGGKKKPDIRISFVVKHLLLKLSDGFSFNLSELEATSSPCLKMLIL